MSRDWVQIDGQVAESAFTLMHGDNRGAENMGEVMANIHRAGTMELCVQYPAFKVTDNSVTFRWDEKLYTLPAGWYILEIQSHGGRSCGRHKLQIGKDCKTNWESSLLYEESGCFENKGT